MKKSRKYAFLLAFACVVLPGCAAGADAILVAAAVLAPLWVLGVAVIAVLAVLVASGAVHD